MFQGNKYLTIGVKEEVEINTQLIMWELIEELNRKDKFNVDYLQVFKLKKVYIDDIEFQQITHKQEVEPYENTEIYITSKAVEAKIFVISSYDENGKEYSTMMLASEY